MSEINYDHFKDLLNIKAYEIDNTIEQMKHNKEAEQDKYSPNELSNYDNHPAEIGTELYQVEHNTALKVHEEHMLKEIHDALIRIDNNQYGKCELCGNDIGEERLEAIPYARLCINCEEDKQAVPKSHRRIRPNEELVLDAPMGRKYLNKQEDDEYEGMDQLNDLMKYGSADSPQDMGGYHDYDDYYTNETDKQGIVDDMDQISNEQYKKQLP